MKERKLSLALCVAFFLITLRGPSTLAAAPPARQPWLWNNTERIAARTDRNLAADRVSAARANSIAEHALRPLATAHISREVDIVNGKEHPELFMPVELFEIVVRDGLLDGDTWREFYVKRLLAAGLPRDFWERLQAVSDQYVEDLRHERQIFQERAHGPKDQDAVEGAVAGLFPTLCRDRYEALMMARKEFGVALDRLMYTYVAGKTTIFTDELPDPNRLRAAEAGCR